MSRLPRWRHKWVGFHCATIFRQTLIQSVKCGATLIQRNSDGRAGAQTRSRDYSVIRSKYGCAKPADPPDKMGFPVHTAHQLFPFRSSTGASGGLLVRIFLPAYSLLTQSGGLIKVKVGRVPQHP